MICPDGIQAGDLMLFQVAPTSSWLDKAIAWGQKQIGHAPSPTAYCHATMVGPDPIHMWESRSPDFHNIPIDWAFLLARNPIDVFRIKDITPSQIDGMMKSAQSHQGERYPWLDIVTLGKLQIGGACYCSEAVWRDALDGAGLKLCNFETMESPDDIAASPLLVLMQHLRR